VGLAHELAHGGSWDCPGRRSVRERVPVSGLPGRFSAKENAPLGAGRSQVLQGGEICMCVVCVREVGRIRRREGR
jgi:hypothetical protein